VDDVCFIIQYLPICVGEHVRAWLEFLPPKSIRSWAELKQVFVRNFLGMYVRPEILGTSRAASRSLASPCGTISAGSPGSAILYPTSSACFSPEPPASPSFTSSVVESRAPPVSSWTSPRTTPPARKWLGRS
jgi:hypothetical protein